MILKLLLLLIGVTACSTAVIFIKLSTEHPVLLSAYRLILAALFLSPFYWRDIKKHHLSNIKTNLTSALLPGLVLGLHLISWIIGARKTAAVNSTIIVTMAPVAMPFFMYYMVREKITSRELLGTALGVGGMIILSLSDLKLDRDCFIGDLLCFFSMLLFCLYLALGKKNSAPSSIWLYIVPMYFTAGIFCFIVSLFFTNPIKHYGVNDVMLILGLTIIPTVIGHSILNYAMRHLRGQVVSIVNMGQFVFSGVLAYMFLGEIPISEFYFTSFLVIGGGILVVTGKQQTPRSID